MFKNNKKRTILIISIIIVVLLIVIINIYNHSKKQKYIQNETNRVLQYTSIEDFKTIEEVCLYLDTELISKEKSEEDNVDCEIKVNFKYNADIDKKNYFENLIQYFAYVLQYRNFYIIDERKGIDIFVLCNSEKQMVTTYYLNGTEMYFENQKANEPVQNISNIEVTELKVKSEILNKIIENNWNISRLDVGTVDSHYRNYEIFFDEGFEIRKINNRVFNIVFTEKYKEEIVENIAVGTSKENVEKVFGKATFESEGIWGYKTEKFYIFFSKEQVSIYPIVNYDTSKIIEIIKNYNDNQDFEKYISQIRTTWDDYDMIETSTNKVIIRYTLKGVTFKYDTTSKRGIIINNNYRGYINETNTFDELKENKDIQLMNNMYFENVDSVFESEKSRVSSLDNYSKFGNASTSRILNISNKYKVKQNSDGKILFISINKQSPNTELRENADTAVWYDDETIIYSVKGKGIYMFDVVFQKYTAIVEGQDEYKIGGITPNKMLYYDKTSVFVNK